MFQNGTFEIYVIFLGWPSRTHLRRRTFSRRLHRNFWKFHDNWSVNHCMTTIFPDIFTSLAHITHDVTYMYVNRISCYRCAHDLPEAETS